MKDAILDSINQTLCVVMLCCICSCVSNCNRNDKLDRIEAALSQIATAEKGAAK